MTLLTWHCHWEIDFGFIGDVADAGVLGDVKYVLTFLVVLETRNMYNTYRG